MLGVGEVLPGGGEGPTTPGCWPCCVMRFVVWCGKGGEGGGRDDDDDGDGIKGIQ